MGGSYVRTAREYGDPGKRGVIARVIVNQGAAGGPLELRPAQLGKKHILVGGMLTLSADGTLVFLTATDPLNGPWDIGAKGGFVLDEHALIETDPNEALQLTTTGGAARGVLLIQTEDA